MACHNKVIRITCPYNLHPLIPEFYIIFFAPKHRLWELVRAALPLPLIRLLQSKNLFQTCMSEIDSWTITNGSWASAVASTHNLCLKHL